MRNQDTARTHGIVLAAMTVAVTATATVTVGCNANTPTYFPATEALDAPGDGTEASGTVALQFRVPSATEQQELDKLSEQVGYEVPWLREDEIQLSIRYTVRNLDEREGQFSVRVAGANQFTRYDEAAVAQAFTDAGEDPVVFGLLEMAPHTIAPGEVYQGTVREDDFHEASLDLDAMGRWMAPFAAVLLNRSDVNPVGTEMVPPKLIVPAMWEVTLHFAATAHMSCTFVVRVRDEHSQLREDNEEAYAPDPATFVPVLSGRVNPQLHPRVPAAR